MNLELLDPFRKQIPDRIDSTLDLPIGLHFRKKLDPTDPQKKGSKKVTVYQDWKSAYHVSFNRRGSYIAVGYGSGTVGVFDVLSRTVSSLYRQEPELSLSPLSSGKMKTTKTKDYGFDDNGVTSLSWSRRSRTLLIGSLGNPQVRLIDTTHPFGPEECCAGIKLDENKDTEDDNQRSQSPTPIDSKDTASRSGKKTPFKERLGKDHFKRPALLQTHIIETQEGLPIPNMVDNDFKRKKFVPVDKSKNLRYPSLQFGFPRGIGNSLQMHPRNACAGQAVLKDGSLVAFSVPEAGFEEHASISGAADNFDSEEKVIESEEAMRKQEQPKVNVATIFSGDEYEIFCSAFDPLGEKLYAATKDGKLLGFEVKQTFDIIAKCCDRIPPLEPSFIIQIPGNAWAWQIVVSRNGRYIVVNSTDAALRLYSTEECWKVLGEVENPRFVFQNVITKVKFVSCDLSGDGEYVVGGAQGNDAKYELYIWNTTTGALMDKLTGSNAELYSVAWHPTRSYLAVAASDGLVDIWGPRINWTAFAPDFQALPRNVEYLECEDEFDIVEIERGITAHTEEDNTENDAVDILTIEHVPVFQSDSEEEEEVFMFETAISRPPCGKGGGDSAN